MTICLCMAFGTHMFTENLIFVPSVDMWCENDPPLSPKLGLIFSWEKWGNWTSFLQGNCTSI